MPEAQPNIVLTIDGQSVTAPAGGTVLDAARRAGIEIPTLCAHEDLPSFGACRLCIVEIDGVRGYPTSCTTPAVQGMVVRTQTPELADLRNATRELMLSGHPNACLVCDHREDCERYKPCPTKAGQSTRCGCCSNRSGCTLREMTLAAPAPMLNLPTLYSNQKVERDAPFIERNHNLCVLCGRCWRICEQIHEKAFISIIHRGSQSRIGTALDQSWVHSGCTFCGACVDICPTGTLTDRYARWHKQTPCEIASTCTLCPEACSLKLALADGQVVATRMTAFKRDARLCAVGRFAYPQLLGSVRRLRQPMAREEGDLAPLSWEEAISAAAKTLEDYRDGSFLAIVEQNETREVLWLYKRFAVDVMCGRLVVLPPGGGPDDIPEPVLEALVEGRFRAVWLAGDYLSSAVLEKVERLIVADFLPSAASRRADAVLPVAILAETEGTIRHPSGELKRLGPAIVAPGHARPEWAVVAAVAKALGGVGFDYVAVYDIGANITNGSPAPARGHPRDRLADLPTRFRGHLLADVVLALQEMGLPSSPPPPLPSPTFTSARKHVHSDHACHSATSQPGGFLIVEREQIAPNFHRVVIEAPAIAKFAKPGQFVIMMVHETSERAPYTLIDWDAAKGTITLLVEEVGRASQEIAFLRPGSRIAHASGPLGVPFPIGTGQTVVLGGGCYGVGGIYPIARALKNAGNTVMVAIEACSASSLFMERHLRAVSHQLHIATKDGSRGRKGGVQELFVQLQQGGLHIDQFVAMGCTFMMRMVAEKTAPLGIPLQVALNPIMLDGTGMCGACRVAVGKETKFACVDGPFFDGHAVDWDQLFARRNAFAKSEIEAIPQTGGAAGTAKVSIKEPRARLPVLN